MESVCIKLKKIYLQLKFILKFKKYKSQLPKIYNNNEKDLLIWEYHSVWLLESYPKNNMKDEICPCCYLVTGMDFSRI